MRKQWRVVGCLVAFSLLGSLTSQGNDHWLTDMDQALAQAESQDKPILIDFTGSDWCVWCVRLDKEVFDTEAFQQQAPERFVLVKLDFPRNKSILTEAEHEHNKSWSDKFSINAFPTILLVDSQGRPFAKTGYQEGGPENYLKQLGELSGILERRNQLLAEAQSLAGLDRAKKLDEALSSLEEGFATAYYADIINEIGQLDSEDAVGLRTKYFAAEDKEKQESLMARIRLASRSLSPDLALKTIDEALLERKLPSAMRLEGLQLKLQVLREKRATDAMINVIDEMLLLEGLPSDTYQSLLVQKAYTLVGANKQEAAIELLSERITSTLENRQLYVTRGELFSRLERFEEALKDYQVAWDNAKNDPDLKMELALARADCLVALEKTDEAIALLDEVAGLDALPGELQAELLVQKAMILREVGRSADAEIVERQALARIEDPKEKERLRQVIEQLRK